MRRETSISPRNDFKIDLSLIWNLCVEQQVSASNSPNIVPATVLQSTTPVFLLQSAAPARLCTTK